MSSPKELKDLLAIATNRYIEEAIFIKPFDMTIESLGEDSASMKFAAHKALTASIRNPNLQGGAIATVLDVVGSLAVFASVIGRMKGKSALEKVEALEKGMIEGKGAWRMSTIDLRIDYLRPGRGEYYLASARILRTGKTVAVTRMELHNDQDKLIAVGTGTYIVG
ncbi:MAG: thioesterase family protein [Chloroflexi bacterium]|nr:thioesterase family protein [Chloroflexota bacterium]